MSSTLQTILAVGGGLLLGAFSVWLGNRRPSWRKIRNLLLAAVSIAVGVFIALGYGDRWDAVWPVLFAIQVLGWNWVAGEPVKVSHAPRGSAGTAAQR